MSKGNMLLGHARGKVGSLVFSRTAGKQVVRSKSDVVRNPQTTKQTIQRIILNTIVQAYSKMSAIVDHSFQGVNPGQDSMAIFMKQNLNMLRTRIAEEIQAGYLMEEIFSVTPLGTKIFVPNNYLLSTGKLPNIAVLDGSADATMDVAITANTYAALIENYTLKRGDQLTFLAIVGDSAQNVGFKFVRVILDPRNADGSEAPLSTAFATDNKIVLPSSRNEGDFTSLSYTNGKLSFGFSDDYMFAGAVIVSRETSEGVWERSTTYMTANPSSSERYYSLGYALTLFEQGGILTDSDRYLNNAGVGNVVNANIDAPRITAAQVNGNAISAGQSASVSAVDSVRGNAINADGKKVGLINRNASGTSYEVGTIASGTFAKTSGFSVANGTYDIAIFEGTISSPEVVSTFGKLVVASALPGGGGEPEEP